MNRESLGRILLLLVVGLPSLCVTWLLTQLVDQSLEQNADLRARITEIEARQVMDARTLRTIQIAQRTNESSMGFVKEMLKLHMDSAMKQDIRDWELMLEIKSEVYETKLGVNAIREKVDPPPKPFGKQ